MDHHRIVSAVVVAAALFAWASGPIPITMDAARKTAIHECSVKAARWQSRNRQAFQLAAYRTCMASHTQQE